MVQVRRATSVVFPSGATSDCQDLETQISGAKPGRVTSICSKVDPEGNRFSAITTGRRQRSSVRTSRRSGEHATPARHPIAGAEGSGASQLTGHLPSKGSICRAWFFNAGPARLPSEPGCGWTMPERRCLERDVFPLNSAVIRVHDAVRGVNPILLIRRIP